MTKNKKMKQWDIGDVYAYALKSALAKERGLLGQFLLVQKVSEEVWSPRNIVPVVYTKITQDGRLPQNVKEYDQLEYVQTCFTRYENRFYPLDFSRLEEDLAQKSHRTYEVDEYGFLPQFRAIILKAARETVPNELFYVGRFSDAVRPNKEFIPDNYLNQRLIYWKKNAELFESLMIKAYCEHNLRELSVYRSRDQETEISSPPRRPNSP